MRQVVPLAGHEVVDDADFLAAAHKFLREVGSDETGAAGNEVVSQG